MSDQVTNRNDDAEAPAETVDLARRAAFKKYASLVAGGAVVAMTPAEVLAQNSYKQGNPDSANTNMTKAETVRRDAMQAMREAQGARQRAMAKMEEARKAFR